MSDLIEETSLILKLVSGDTILCQVIKDTDDNILVRDPYLVNLIQGKAENEGRAVVYYSQWFLSSDSRIHMIRKNHVLSAAIPDQDTKDYYAELVERKEDGLSQSKDVKSTTTSKNKSNSNNPFSDDLNYKLNNKSKSDPNNRFNN
jgi:hypothetical protein